MLLLYFVYICNFYGWWCICNICLVDIVKFVIVDFCFGNICEYICVLIYVRENYGLGYKCICVIGYEFFDNGVNCISKNKKCSKIDILIEKR